MTSLPINLDELSEALNCSDLNENHYFLDTRTGEILIIMDEFYKEDADEEDEAYDKDLPEWQRDAHKQARIVGDTEGRFVDIPNEDRNDAYGLMEEFIASLHDERAKDLLSRAIAGKGAFRRFKDTLMEFPVLRQQWFDFEARSQYASAEEWLESINLRSTWVPPKGPTI